ncbi:MAG: GNAT family N-acetyltransferase [Acidobacteria bacterium]|nr:GNAT family N-acetyltransferase [Acidobacteriota bacterium]
MADFEACIDLQRRVWQFSDLDIIPMRAFVINLHSGGLTQGAFDSAGRMIGFSHALAAFEEDLSPFYYSHMLAVDAAWRDAGVGWRLKLAQRELALRSGVTLIRWTFDPLQSRNANLNIRKLGGVVREYKVNYYGNGSTSELHRGLDTDRLFVEWWLDSPRVVGAIEGRSGALEPEEKPAGEVTIPRDIDTLKRHDMESARASQIAVRTGFENFFRQGLYCGGFEATPEGPSRYLFYSAGAWPGRARK